MQPVCAVTNKHTKVVELLLNAGANIHQESRGGHSSLGGAMRYYHTEKNAAAREQRKAILDLLDLGSSFFRKVKSLKKGAYFFSTSIFSFSFLSCVSTTVSPQYRN